MLYNIVLESYTSCCCCCYY